MADLRFFVTQEGTLNQGGSGNDTVFNYTGAFSSDTVKGLDGKDLISFANQTTSISVRAYLSAAASAGHGSAGQLNAIYHGTYVSAGKVESGAFTAGSTAVSAGATVEASATVDTLQQTGLQTIRGGLIGGNTGNDSIYLGDQLTTFSNVFVGGGQGNDLLGTFNSGANTAGKLNGNFSGSTLAGGLGNDTVFVNLSGNSGSNFKVAGNSGSDSVMLSAVSAELSGGLVGGGGGNDSVIVIARSGQSLSIRGGDGDDSIDAVFSAGTKSTLIEGDGSTTGADTIRVSLGAAYSSNTLLGGDGNDSIVLSGLGADGGGNKFDAGTGTDTVFFQSAGASDISGATIKGGAGGDSILINAMSAGAVVSSIVYGQKGDDTITLAVPKIGSAGSNNLTIMGGLGADSITNSGIGADAGTGVFQYKGYGESTLDSMDTITFNTAAISAGGAAFISSRVRVNITTGSVALVSGAGASGQISATGGYVVFSGYSDDSLTARVSAIDASFTTTGDAGVFTTDNTTRYLFVQGGTTDMVVRLSNEASLSAGKAGIFRSGNVIGFGDSDA